MGDWLEWKIFYGDGLTFSNDDGLPEKAPALNVQFIVQIDPDSGRYNQSGADFYIRRDDRWVGVDLFGLFDFLMESGLVKFGRTIGTKRFRELHSLAEADSGFPKRGSYRPGERK